MELRRVVFLAVLLGCKSPSPGTATSAPSVTPSASASVAIALADAAAPAPATTSNGRWNLVDALVVSSRVDNGTESPENLVDGDLATAWSSRTGDLVGAWVALRLVKRPEEVHEIAMTVGMTKDDDLFKKNVRIAEVQISFNDVVVRDHFRLDIESRALQAIPVTVQPPGVLKITVQSIQPGTKADWREITISELELRSEAGKLVVTPPAFLVGSFDPKPRGVLGIVPEKRVPLGCLAALPSVPRVYCAVGQSGTEWHSASVVSIDKGGMKTIAPLLPPTESEPRIPYADWLRVEHALSGGITLDPKSAKAIPWAGEITIEGTTFRQRTTKEDRAGDAYNGVLEVRFPGATTFTKLFDELAPYASSAMEASASPVGSMWVVERSGSHGSEGMYMSEADATLCDLHAHTCTPFVMPPDPRPSN